MFVRCVLCDSTDWRCTQHPWSKQFIITCRECGISTDVPSIFRKNKITYARAVEAYDFFEQLNSSPWDRGSDRAQSTWKELDAAVGWSISKCITANSGKDKLA